MSSHSDKFFTKLLIGFGAIIAAVLIIFYAIFEASHDSDWYFLATGCAILLGGGIYFCLSAFVHKIKSDFSRRQKQKESQSSSTRD